MNDAAFSQLPRPSYRTGSDRQRREEEREDVRFLANAL